MSNKKKIGKKGGFYIALCGCAVVVALMGYVGNFIKDDEEIAQNQSIALENTENESYIEKETAQEEKDEPETIVIEPKREEKSEPKTEPSAEETAAKTEAEEFVPNLPVSGKVLADFSGDKFIHYKNLDDWRTHSGIDLEAAVGDDVYLCDNGTVEKIYHNNLGGCILVDHKNGYKSLYANLGETDLVNVGDELKKGETIGRVGNTAVGDLTVAPHVHFEIYQDGKAVNPLDLIPVE